MLTLLANSFSETGRTGFSVSLLSFTHTGTGGKKSTSRGERLETPLHTGAFDSGRKIKMSEEDGRYYGKNGDYFFCFIAVYVCILLRVVLLLEVDGKPLELQKVCNLF